MEIVWGSVVGLVILLVGIPIAVQRWAGVVPPFGRWVVRRFPRFSRLYGIEARTPRKQEEDGF